MALASLCLRGLVSPKLNAVVVARPNPSKLIRLAAALPIEIKGKVSLAGATF